MSYTIIEAPQGSEAWHLARKNCFTASEAPAALGVSKYQTRDELLAQKKTGLVKEVDAATQKRFDRGHETEALARVIAETIIGEELYPITARTVEHYFPLLASMDGLTLTGDIGFEHKLLSSSLVEQVKNQSLEPHYTVQMDQQILVTGCQKVLFMTSDGTQENCHWMWYESTQEKQNALLAGWEQFETDLANYVPPVQVEKVVAETVEALPVPSVVVRGEITQSNIAEITPKFDAYLTSIKTELSTDQDFADAEEIGKNCEATEKRIQALRENIIAQMISVNEVDSTLAKYQKSFKDMKVFLKNAVTEQKTRIKTNAILQAKCDYAAFVSNLQGNLPITLHQHLTVPDFADAIKGVSKLESMHNRINDALAQGKAQATTMANDIKAKSAYIEEASKGYAHLINVGSLATKDMDYIKLHIQSVKDAEDKRKAEHEAAIKAKAEAEARAKVEAEQRAKELADAQAILDARAEAQPINGAKPEVAQSEATPSRQDQVSEKQSSPAPTELEQALKQTFAATKERPSREQIVSIVADHYGVSHHQAQGWLNDLFYAMAA